jgi:hypothetical protein
MSDEYLAAPVTFSTPSFRSTERPMTVSSRSSVGGTAPSTSRWEDGATGSILT